MAIGRTLFIAFFTVSAVANAAFYDNGCPRDWSVNTHLPHPTECELFYQCVHGNKVLFHCPEGLVFNIELQVCDWPWNVDCSRPGLNPTTTSPEITETTETGVDEENDGSTTVSYESTTLQERELTTEPGPTTENYVFTTTTVEENIPTTTDFIPTTTIENETTTTEATTEYVPSTTTVNQTIPTTTETTTEYVPTTTDDLPTTIVDFESTTTEATTDYVPSTTTAEETVPTTTDDVPTTIVDFESTSTEATTEYVPSTTTLNQTYPTTTIKSSTTTTTEYIPTTTTEEPICPPGFFGNVPHPDYRDLFYFCSGGIAIKQRCPAGQEFNPDTTRCEPINAGETTTFIVPTENTEEPTDATESYETTTKPEQDEITTISSIPETTLVSEIVTEDPICRPGFFGNVPHPVYCNKFFFCSGGIAIKQRCPEGQEFDPDTTVCVPITGYGCTQTTTSEEPTTTGPSSRPICEPGFFGNVAHPDYCNAFFFCSGGIPIMQWCAAGQEFDPEVATCVTRKESGCSKPVTPETTTQNVQIDSDEQNDEEDELDVGDNHSEEVDDVICQPGFFGNVPHPQYCDKFFFCSGGMAIKQRCPVGQVFDQQVSRCAETRDNSCAVQTRSTKCPKGFSGYIPHSQLSSVFIYCSESGAMELHCSDGFEFNSYQNNCTDIPTTKIRNPRSIEQPRNQTSGDVPVCPPELFGNLPHPYICESYFMCSGGLAIQLWCANGFEFDPVVDNCVPITGNGCTQTTSVSPTTSTTQSPSISSTTNPTSTTKKIPTDPLCPPDFFGNIPHPTLCDSYYLCSMGMKIQLWCANGFEYDPITEKCVPITGNGCTQTTSVSPTTSTTQSPSISSTTNPTSTTKKIPTDPLCPPDFFGNIPHPTLCDSYYLCSMGIKIQLWCANGFEYDPINENCVPITGNGCTQTTSVSPTTSTTQSPSFSSTINPTSTTKKIPTDPLCPPDFFGNIPHPTLCDSYYLCSMGIKIQLWCANGFEYDPINEKCFPISEDGCFANQN